MSTSSSSVRRRIKPSLESLADGRKIDLEGDPTIGRLPENDIQIKDARISRKHAAIMKCKGEYTIRDLESKNGTYVNKKKIDHVPVSLEEGDLIQMGLCKFVYHKAGYQKL